MTPPESSAVKTSDLPDAFIPLERADGTPFTSMEIANEVTNIMAKSDGMQGTLAYRTWDRLIDIRTDAVVSKAMNNTLMPNDPQLNETLWILYDNASMMSAIIDGDLAVLLQGDEDGQTYIIDGPDGEIADKVFQITLAHGMAEKQEQVMRELGVTGNSILQLEGDVNQLLVDSEPIPTATRVWRGILGISPDLTYTQKDGIMEADADKQAVPQSRIIHHRNADRPGAVWGRASFQPVIRELVGITNAHHDLPVIVKRYSAPTRVAKVDREKLLLEFGEAVINDPERTRQTITDLLRSWHPGKDIGLPEWMTLEVLDNKLSTFNTDLIHTMENVVLGSQGFPRHAYIDINNRSTAEALDAMQQRRARSRWRAMQNTWNQQYIWPLMKEMFPGMTGSDIRAYTWKYLSPIESEEMLEKKALKNAKLIESGIFTEMQIAELEYGISEEEFVEAREKMAELTTTSPDPAGADPTQNRGGGGISSTDDPDDLDGAVRDDELPTNTDEIPSSVKSAMDALMRQMESKLNWLGYADGIVASEQEREDDGPESG